MRSFPLLLVLGVALVTGAGHHAASGPAARAAIAAQLDGADRPTQAVPAPEDWPICSVMPLTGAAGEWGQFDADFAAGKKALGAGDWYGAIAALKLAALRDPRNADIQNGIGYAYRRLHELGPAMQYYQTALMLDRRHRNAHEHLGELYLVLGEPAKAEQQLAALGEICLIPCAEYDSLERTITVYRERAAR